ALAVVVLSVEHGGLDRGVASVAARAGLAIPAAIADGAAAKTPTGKPPIENTVRTEEIRRPGSDLPHRPSEASAIPQPPEHERSGSGAQRGSHETAGDGTNASTNEHPLGDVTAHAGGVGRGTLSPDSVPASAARARGESTATYREAWSRAQSAVAIDRVPADRRVLVRKYFSAIGPSESQ